MADEIVYDDELLAAAESDMDTSVGEDFDPDAEYNQPAPPLPDGWYYATLKNLGRKIDGVTKEFEGPRSWGPNITTYYTRAGASVIDPNGPQNNKQATGNVTTHSEKTSSGSPRGSSANMYYKAITGQPLPGVGQGAHIALVAKELRSEPQVWVRTQLQGQDRDAKEAYDAAKKSGTLGKDDKKPPTFKGQKEFTQDGKLTGVKVLEDGTRIVGRPIIQEVKPKSFTPPIAK
jgi:hypothetical protein